MFRSNGDERVKRVRRRWLRKGIRLGLLTAVIAAVVLTVKRRSGSDGGDGDGAWKSSPLSMPMPSAPPAGTATSNGTTEMDSKPEPPLVEPTMFQSLLDRPKTVAGSSSEAGEDAGAATDPPADEQEAPGPATVPTAKAKTSGKAKAAWIEPDGDHCPRSHPVKAKLSSGIYHLVGMRDYGRTTPDRCYRDEDVAQADGLRRAKR